MSNYKFKGTSISTITNTTGGVNTSIGPYYTGFPATLATTYSMMRPLSLGYTITPSSTDVSNYCTASCTDITNSQTVTVPTGVKKFRYLILGGGGSGGGYGGDAKGNQGDGSGSSNGNGGNGGSGGYSVYTVGTLAYSSGTISVTIGTGGSVGNNGTGNSTKGGVAGANPNTANGNNGNSNPGNESYITFDTVKYTSAGGSRGLNGNGANARAAWGNSSSIPGITDVVPDATNYPNYTTSSAIPDNWPPLGGTYGQGGSGGTNANSNSANAGQQGTCRIIWLYE
jgi:hypothetical protein